jgi:cupin 2 domain-containing protein
MAAMENPGHFCSNLPTALPDEISQTVLAGGAFRLERIVSRGQHSPPGFWYDQDEHEWVLLLEGEATLRFEAGDRLLHMTPGACVRIAAHERHRVEWTTPHATSVWLALFYRDA